MRRRERGEGEGGEESFPAHRRTRSDATTTSGGRRDGEENTPSQANFSDVWNNINKNGNGSGGKLPSRGPVHRHQHSRTFSNMSETFYESFMYANSLNRKKFFWVCYFASLVGTWLLLCTFTDPGMALTWLNILHAVTTFPVFHMFKIQKFDKQNIYDMDQSYGDMEPQTYWVQIDYGKMWTKTRKALLIIPVVLYLVATNSVDFTRQPLLINLLAMLLVVVPKLKVSE